MQINIHIFIESQNIQNKTNEIIVWQANDYLSK